MTQCYVQHARWMPRETVWHVNTDRSPGFSPKHQATIMNINRLKYTSKETISTVKCSSTSRSRSCVGLAPSPITERVGRQLAMVAPRDAPVNNDPAPIPLPTRPYLSISTSSSCFCCFSSVLLQLQLEAVSIAFVANLLESFCAFQRMLFYILG